MVVAGIGVSGFAAADGLIEFGARVTVLDDRADNANTEKADAAADPRRRGPAGSGLDR